MDNKTEASFKKGMEASRDTFEFILTDSYESMKPHLNQFQTFFVCCPSLHTQTHYASRRTIYCTTPFQTYLTGSFFALDA